MDAGDAWTRLVYDARAFALERHADQRYGDFPYAFHLELVERTLGEFGLTRRTAPALVAAAWLHDVVEDSEATLTLVRERFGPDVAALVDAVTDGHGDTRAERKQVVYEKIRAHDRNGEPRATALKLADRIANVRSAVELERPRKLAMYQKEMPAFREGLYRVGQLEDMWAMLTMILDTAPSTERPG